MEVAHFALVPGHGHQTATLIMQAINRDAIQDALRLIDEVTPNFSTTAAPSTPSKPRFATSVPYHKNAATLS